MTAEVKIWTTPTAHAKIKEIYNYSCDKWNKETAKKYLIGLEEVIKSIAKGRTAGSSAKTLKVSSNFVNGGTCYK